MGRRAEGWSVYRKRGWAYVSFTHKGTQHRLALNTRDDGEARDRAAQEYADVVSGRRVVIQRRAGGLVDLKVLLAQWLESVDGSVDSETHKTLVIYARRYLAFFKETDLITEASIGDYQASRLREVLRTTLMKERMFFRQFLKWAKLHGAISSVPEFPDVPKKATGVRSGKQRAATVEPTPQELADIIAVLPEQSKTIDGRKWPVRARFSFARETGLRPATLAVLEVDRHWTRGARTLNIEDTDDKARFGRTVPLTAEAVRILEEFAPEEGLIFGAHNFAKAIKTAAKKVLRGRRARQFAPYDFRHGRAQELVDETGDLPGVAFLLGWKQITTSNRYARGSQRAAERVLKKVSPNYHRGGGDDEKTG